MKKIALYFTFILFFFLLLLIDFYTVDGESMNKTINNHALVASIKYNKITRQFVKVNRGDDIVFKYYDKTGKEKMILKKVFGALGDTCVIYSYLSTYSFFEIKNKGLKKRIYLNKESRDFFSKKQQYWFVTKKREEIPLVNHYFVVGTNEDVSFDSRNFGPVSEKSVKGIVLFSF
jgi:signal peptidase I